MKRLVMGSSLLLGLLIGMSFTFSGCDVHHHRHVKSPFHAKSEKVYHLKDGRYCYHDDTTNAWYWLYMMDSNNHCSYYTGSAPLSSKLPTNTSWVTSTPSVPATPASGPTASTPTTGQTASNLPYSAGTPTPSPYSAGNNTPATGPQPAGNFLAGQTQAQLEANSKADFQAACAKEPPMQEVQEAQPQEVAVEVDQAGQPPESPTAETAAETAESNGGNMDAGESAGGSDAGGASDGGSSGGDAGGGDSGGGGDGGGGGE